MSFCFCKFVFAFLTREIHIWFGMTPARTSCTRAVGLVQSWKGELGRYCRIFGFNLQLSSCSFGTQQLLNVTVQSHPSFSLFRSTVHRGQTGLSGKMYDHPVFLAVAESADKDPSDFLQSKYCSLLSIFLYSAFLLAMLASYFACLNEGIKNHNEWIHKISKSGSTKTWNQYLKCLPATVFWRVLIVLALKPWLCVTIGFQLS